MGNQQIEFDEDEAVRLYNEGIGFYKLQKQLGVPAMTIWRRLKLSGRVKIRDSRCPKETKRKPFITPEKLSELYRERGLSAKEIGDMYGVSSHTVHQRLLYDGVPKREAKCSVRNMTRLFVDEGKSIEEISELLCTNERTVKKWLTKAGIAWKPPRKRSTHPAEVEAVEGSGRTLFEHQGKRMNMSEWANELGIGRSSFSMRVCAGLPEDKLFKKGRLHRTGKLYECKGDKKTLTEWANYLGKSVSWMHTQLYKKGRTIEEIIENGHHVKSDYCRAGKLIEYNGEKRTVKEWAKRLDISLSWLYVLLRKKSLEEIVERYGREYG